MPVTITAENSTKASEGFQLPVTSKKLMMFCGLVIPEKIRPKENSRQAD
jgi:hypothetical protein